MPHAIALRLTRIAQAGKPRVMSVSAMQPVTVLAIVWAALMDVAVWGKTSDIWTFVGAAIIVVATTYIARGEARLGARE